MKTHNITLSLPKDILQKVKLIAVKRHTSVSRLLTRLLEEMVAREEGYERARKRHVGRLDENNLGTRGRPIWRREDLHER